MITFKKAALGTAMAATLAAGMLAGAAPADAHPYYGRGYYGHGGGGLAVAAGVIGLAAGVAIASDHGYAYPAPVGYYAPPVAYGYNGCYNAYPGYEGYCYPVGYYTNLGWGYHDGGWWYGGARYARPFVVGGYRGGAGYYHGGYGYRGGYGGGAYHGGGYGGGAHYAGGGGYHGGGGHGGGGGGHR